MLGGSNRGGRRERKKKRVDGSQPQSEAQPQQPLPPLTATASEGSFHTLGNLGTTWPQDPAVQPFGEELRAPRSESSNTDELPFSNLQNPSDALDILAKVAGESSSNDENIGNGNGIGSGIGHVRGSSLSMPAPLSFSYPLLDRGVLTVHSLCQLLVRFQQQYHPFYPLAPAHAFEASHLSEMVNNEEHLLTAILLIASKDLVDEPHIYEACSEHMKSLVSALAAGGDAGIEAVEALLLLAEWAPYTQRGSGKVGKGEEDKESWMHVGLALRIAYFLALDRYSFRFVDQGLETRTLSQS